MLTGAFIFKVKNALQTPLLLYLRRPQVPETGYRGHSYQLFYPAIFGSFDNTYAAAHADGNAVIYSEQICSTSYFDLGGGEISDGIGLSPDTIKSWRFWKWSKMLISTPYRLPFKGDN